MMIFDRYIGMRILINTLLVLLVLLAIDVFFALVHEFKDVGQGLYSGWYAMQYVLLTIPRRAIDLFSMSALLGSLLALGSMVSNNELVALRASGVSISRIVRSVLQAGLLMFILVAVVGEWLAPFSEQLARENKAQAQSQQIAYQSDHGIWVKDEKRFVNIRKLGLDGHLEDVYVYEFDDHHKLTMVTQAAHVAYGDGRWILEDVKFSVLSDTGIHITKQDKVLWDSLLNPVLLNMLARDPDYLSARDLWAYIIYMDKNNLDSKSYQLAFWNRMVMPFSGMVMLFLAVPFVFGPLRSVGVGQRILVGVLVGVFFYVFSQMISHISQVSGINPIVSAFFPSLVFMFIGIWMVRRAV